jgi:hypothetical protein
MRQDSLGPKKQSPSGINSKHQLFMFTNATFISPMKRLVPLIMG